MFSDFKLNKNERISLYIDKLIPLMTGIRVFTPDFILFEIFRKIHPNLKIYNKMRSIK